MSDFRRKNLNGGRGVADLGIAAILTHYTIEPAELARFAEEQGFESLRFLQPSRFAYGGVQPGLSRQTATSGCCGPSVCSNIPPGSAVLTERDSPSYS